MTVHLTAYSTPNFTLSIVSHGHRAHIRALMQDLATLSRDDFDVVLTRNLPEDLPLDLGTLPYTVTVIDNPTPKGFAANHNAAAQISQGKHFVILNPDVRLLGDPFTALAAYMNQQPKAVCAPLVVNKQGTPEDSARDFPTPFFLAKKLIFKLMHKPLAHDVIPENELALFPDWVAGMFIVVPHNAYLQLGGLNERYHMYYEDVDFCVRARLAGHSIAVVKGAKVIHEAQRDSHRKLKHLLWHVHSIVKFFMSSSYWQLKLSSQHEIGKD